MEQVRLVGTLMTDMERNYAFAACSGDGRSWRGRRLQPKTASSRFPPRIFLTVGWISQVAASDDTNRMCAPMIECFLHRLLKSQ